jgi:hypothetical protein
MINAAGCVSAGLIAFSKITACLLNRITCRLPFLLRGNVQSPVDPIDRLPPRVDHLGNPATSQKLQFQHGRVVIANFALSPQHR